MSTLLNNRDYLGAITLIEFERKMFMDKQASGWHDAGNGNYQWVEGGKAQLTHDEARQDAERVMWLAYAAFHAGNYQQALDAYQSLLDKGSDDAMLHVYMGCCLERLGWHQEAEERAQKGPPCPLQNRLLFHLSHRVGDENKLMCTTRSWRTRRSTSCRSRRSTSCATTSRRPPALQAPPPREPRLPALNVYVALCYWLDYYDVSLEILAAYLQGCPTRRSRST